MKSTEEFILAYRPVYAYMYIHLTIHSNVLIIFITKDPIPGGCNMEFAVPIAPYLVVNYTPDIIKVENQPSSAPYSKYQKPPPCEAEIMEHEVYHLYLTERDFSSESYFEGIKKMLTVKRIRENGKLVGKKCL